MSGRFTVERDVVRRVSDRQTLNLAACDVVGVWALPGGRCCVRIRDGERVRVVESDESIGVMLARIGAAVGGAA